MHLDNKKILFGPAGNSNSFYAEGHKQTLEMPKWVAARGLSAFEYSFGRGVNIGADTAIKIGEEAAAHGIAMSAHAPYYINFASEKPENRENSFGYVLRSLEVLKNFGGNRLVFHAASASKIDRGVAMSRTKESLLRLADVVKEAGYGDMILCPETMGKHSQIGTVEEIAELAALDEIFVPCVDFGHVNSYMGGKLKTRDDYKKIVDTLIEAVGEKKTKNMHVHFSKIQYGSSGEIRHLDFSDAIYGPPFEPMLEVFSEYKLTPVVICESDGTMAEDAVTMKKYWGKL